MSYSITTINHSTTAWHRHFWNAPSDAAFTINTQPNETLAGGNGTEALSWSQTGSTFGSGGTDNYADGEVVWTAPNGKAFGIYIHIPVQIIMIGTAPYYRTKTEADGGWDGEHTGDPVNFDKSIGFDIVAKAVAEHQALHVTVTINDL